MYSGPSRIFNSGFWGLSCYKNIFVEFFRMLIILTRNIVCFYSKTLQIVEKNTLFYSKTRKFAREPWQAAPLFLLVNLEFAVRRG